MKFKMVVTAFATVSASAVMASMLAPTVAYAQQGVAMPAATAQSESIQSIAVTGTQRLEIGRAHV